MQVVNFGPRYLDWVRAGTKTRTTRYREPVEPGPASLRFESDPPEFLDTVITRIRSVALDELVDDDAATEKFADAGAVREALRYHYPDLPADADLTVVSFELT